MAKARSATVLLILASSLFVFFNAIATGLFFYADTLDATSDANAGLTILSLGLAWLGDLVGLVLGVAGAIVGRQRAGWILWGVALVLLAIGAACFSALMGFVSAVARMPVPIH